MSQTHQNRDHNHGPDCEHTGVQHGDHVDYLHDRHLTMSPTMARSLNTASKLPKPTPVAAHRRINVVAMTQAMFMDRFAVTNQYHMATILNNLSMVIFIVRTATIATITAL
ncbi:hypothetical protein N9D23_08895 [Rubripirellula sp.]|nr:hypothetical protein [Rubripirellula sp.]